MTASRARRIALLVLMVSPSGAFADEGPTTRASDGTRVYASTFGQAIQWSPFKLAETPNHKRTFLGGFVDDPVSLTISALPPHEFVRVRFDLLILMTWDGSGRVGWGPAGKIAVGPDLFNVSVEGGPLLMSQTFSNVPKDDGFRNETKYQSYPSPVPGERLPAQTGAAERQTLGYRYDVGPGFNMDAVYHVSLLIPHTGDVIALNFAAPGLQRITAPPAIPDESWGLDNVVVEAIPPGEVSPPDANESRRMLDQAVDVHQPVTAGQAFESLCVGGPGVRETLKDARDAAHIDWAAVERLVGQLASPDDSAEANARQKLLAMGAVVEMPLRVVAQTAASEGREHDAIDEVLDELLTAPIQDDVQRRAAVANRVLEIIGPK